jgi:nicotinamidase-related amidase
MQPIAKLDPTKSAVLALDCQKGVIAAGPGYDRILKPAIQLLEAARARKIPVLHVGVGFRPGYPEIHPEHPSFGMLRQSGRFIVGTESAEFHEAIAPQAGEITIVKHRVSAFSGSDLEMILRSQGITHLVLFGIATSGVVLSTLRQASDLDFRSIVVKDCCADGDEEVHRVLTEKVFVRQAMVAGAETLVREMI